MERETKKISLLLEDLTALEEYVHDIFGFFPLPICFVSPSRVILEANPAMEKLSGFKLEEIVGESVERFFKKEEIGQLTKETLQQGFVEGRELKLFPKKGESIFAQAFTRTRRDEKGEAVGYFLCLSDLTEIKRTEAELKRTQAALLNILEDSEEARKRAEAEKDKTQAIITNFGDGLLFFDQNYRLLLINPQAEVFFQIGKEKVLNRSLADLGSLPELRPLLDLLGPEIATVSRREFSLRKDLILEVSVILVKSAGRDLGRLVVLHDVSREKMVERLKSEFVSLTAHQLRTPLSAIKWSLKMMLEGDLGKVSREQQELLAKTYQSNERMINLINDLLNLARIEEGRYLLQPRPVKLIDLCRGVVQAIKESFERKGIKFVFLKPVREVPLILADEEKLCLALQNLLDNALKYTRPGGRVSLSLKEVKEGIRIIVKDNGLGIDPAEQTRVFSKFFRSKKAILQEPTGTGLGLYLVKNIIESHGGRIWFKSKLGQGTTFYLVLPRQSGPLGENSS